VKVTFLAMAQTYKNGDAVHTVLISTTSTFPKEGTIVAQYENDPRRAAIITSIDSKFFLRLPYGENRATLQGFALIKTGSGSTQSDSSFHVDVNMISLPSSQPGMIPSKSVPPSTLPSSRPSSSLNGLPKHVEVWACQCRTDASCSPDVLTNFNNHAKLCVSSTRTILEIDFLLFRGNKSVYQMVDDGKIIDGDRSSLKIEIEGRGGTIDFNIPGYFFEGMDSLTAGKALGIAILRSASGGESEVGFHADLNFMFQAHSDSPTRSPPPSLQESNPPSLSAHPSQHPSFSPSTSAGPTVLRNVAIRACQCDKSQRCVEEPLIPSSRKVRFCLLSQPQMYIFKTTVVAVLTQRGVADHPIIQGDRAIDNDMTNIKKSGLRRRLIETTVPYYFFANPSENLKVNGIGTLLQTGSTISRDVEFSITLTLLSQPTEVPSASPSTSSKPTFEGPTVRPTQSHEPSSNPSKSMMPTEEQTIGFKYCPCDIQSACLLEPVTLTFTDRSIRICLQAWPNNAEMKVPYVQVKNKPVRLETQLDENIGVVTGNLSEDFFDVGPLDDVAILGKVDIFVQQGNKRAEVGFFVQYKLESLTATPTDTPTTSAAPTVVPPLGVHACQCSKKKCLCR